MTKLTHHLVPLLFMAGGVGLSLIGLRPVMADLLILSVYYLLLAGSWNVLAGFAGQYSFAHIGLATAGAYGTAALVIAGGLSGWASLVIMPVAVALLGGGLGLVALRVRGVQLPLITFAFAGAFAVFLAAASDITNGSMGLQLPKLVPGFDRSLYLILGGILAGLFFVVQNRLIDGKLGLLMQAIRDNEDIAHGMGVSLFRVKIAAFMITAAIAGLAGSFYANYVGVLAPSMLSMSEMGYVVAMAVIGGLGYRYGPLIGVVIIRSIEYFVRGFGAEYTLVIITGIALLVVLFFREGVIAYVSRLMPHRTARWRS